MLIYKLSYKVPSMHSLKQYRANGSQLALCLLILVLVKRGMHLGVAIILITK